MMPMLGSLIQLPIIMSCFMGIRKLCETVPSVRTVLFLMFIFRRRRIVVVYQSGQS